MMIPPFPLPSNISKVIHFRVPSVEDGMMFSDLNPSQEEAHTTEFLNHLQNTKKSAFSDSKEWTGEDRRTALWWIFISSNPNGNSVPFSYHCQACDCSHVVNVDLNKLFETTTALEKLPKNKVEISISGKKKKVIVRPLDGHALEDIEMQRNALQELEPKSSEYRKASNEMKMSELAHCLDFLDENETHLSKVEKIKKMYLKTEFSQAFGVVEQSLREARHGLLSQYNEGRYFLVTQIDECPKAVEKGGKESKLLLLPFHNLEYIPTI